MKGAKQALLVIDMQKGSFTPLVSRFDALGVVRRINILAENFRQLAYPVIYVQHDGTAEQAFIPGTTEWELLDELDVEDEDIILPKTANDAFYKSSLTEVLKKNEIRHVVITGCATDFCVEATIQSALSKDYHISIIENGHTTGNRPHLNAAQVIEHYNWMWQHMIPTRGHIKVVSTSDYLAKIPN